VEIDRLAELGIKLRKVCYRQEARFSLGHYVGKWALKLFKNGISGH